MSDPFGRVLGMVETNVSASHFRVHLKEIANSVARGEEACTVERHGLAIGVLVSVEDAEYLRRHKWSAAQAAAKPEAGPRPEADTIRLIHPAEMPLELVQEAYDLTTGSTDFDIQAWRYKAFFSIYDRTGKKPAPYFGPSG